MTTERLNLTVDSLDRLQKLTQHPSSFSTHHYPPCRAGSHDPSKTPFQAFSLGGGGRAPFWCRRKKSKTCQYQESADILIYIIIFIYIIYIYIYIKIFLYIYIHIYIYIFLSACLSRGRSIGCPREATRVPQCLSLPMDRIYQPA